MTTSEIYKTAIFAVIDYMNPSDDMMEILEELIERKRVAEVTGKYDKTCVGERKDGDK